MLANVSKWLRVSLAAVLIGWPTGSAEAGWWTRPKAEPTHAVAAARDRGEGADPAVGVAVMAGAVAFFVVVAWAAAKMGGSRGVPVNDLPE